jgi:hypothetical protein
MGIMAIQSPIFTMAGAVRHGREPVPRVHGELKERRN